MPDSNFNTGIDQLLARAITLIPTAGTKELYEISVCLKAIGKTEDTTAETAFVNRFNTLLQASLSTTQKNYIARAIGNMLEADFVDGVDLPSQTSNINKLLQTNGLSLSWVKANLNDINNVNVTSPTAGDTLSIDVNSDLVNVVSPTKSFETYANVAGLPVSDTTGKIAYAIAEDSFHYWDGSSWNEITTSIPFNWIDANTIWYASYDTNRNEQIANYGNGGTNQVNGNTAVVSATSTGISGNALKNINSGGVEYNFSSFSMGSNFTVEFWGYIDTLGSTPAYWFDTGMVEYRTDNIKFSGAGGTTNTNITASTANATGQWVHHAIVYQSSMNAKVYHNGSQVASFSTNAGTPNISRVKLYGHETQNNGIDSAYIKHFRISNVARYTTSFTSPPIE